MILAVFCRMSKVLGRFLIVLWRFLEEKSGRREVEEKSGRFWKVFGFVFLTFSWFSYVFTGF